MDDDRLILGLRRIAEPVEPSGDFLDRLYESLADELGFQGRPASAHELGRRGRRSRRMRIPLWIAAAVLLALAILGSVAVVGALLEHSPAPDLPTSHGVWIATGGLVEGRVDHTATLLPDGRVLVAGSDSEKGASAELYDPGSGTSRATGKMLSGRVGHSATLLRDGRVLVAGGSREDPSTTIATAELYDPRTETWTATGNLIEGRVGHTATLLPDGTVLVVGGGKGDLLEKLSSAEVYDPVAGTWTAAGETNSRRTWHTATLLPDGTVLIAGGDYDVESTALSDLYDPATRSWTATSPMTMPRIGHTATLLPDGTVLVAGGDGGGPLDGTAGLANILASAELYDPESRSWTTTASMTEQRWLHGATLLVDGTVLVTGSGYLSQDGQPSATAELYDPGERTWTATASLRAARHFHTVTLLPDGTVLVAGGALEEARLSAEVYHPNSGR